MAEQQEIQLWQTVAPVEFVPRIAGRTEAQALLIATRRGPGYQVAGGQLAHAIQSRATHILMDYSQNACALRYQIDGNWEQLPPLDRETGDAMLYALKQLCQLNPADRRSSQTGMLGLKIGKQKFILTIQSQGVASGERVLAKIETEKVPFEKMAHLGMRDKMYLQFKEKLDGEGNIVLITAPKGEGLTTSWITSLNAADRYMRDFQSFEEEAKPEPETINISANYFGGQTGLTLQERLQKSILREPDVLLFPELPDPESMALAVKQVEKLQKQIYCRMVADGAMQAITSFLARYKQSAPTIAATIGAVLGRSSCVDCATIARSASNPPHSSSSNWGFPRDVSRCFINPSSHLRLSSRWMKTVVLHRLNPVTSAVAEVTLAGSRSSSC